MALRLSAEIDLRKRISFEECHRKLYAIILSRHGWGLLSDSSRGPPQPVPRTGRICLTAAFDHASTNHPSAQLDLPRSAIGGHRALDSSFLYLATRPRWQLSAADKRNPSASSSTPPAWTAGTTSTRA